ncbi:hypothetical protein PMAYCL1PPCAC_05138, partial [Pristionchus mayeri]
LPDAMTHRLLLLAQLCLLAVYSTGSTSRSSRCSTSRRSSCEHEIIPAQFGPPLKTYQHTHSYAQLSAATIYEVCGGLQDDMTGRVVIMPRGECTFVEKVANAEAAGALFELVTDLHSNSSEDVTMTSDEFAIPINIPSAYIAGTAGSRLHNFLPYNYEPVVVDIPISITDCAILVSR